MAIDPPRVGAIEFYGVRKVDRGKLLKAIGVKPGDSMPKSKGDAEERLEDVPGVVAAHIEAVCCQKGQAILFVGIEESGVPRYEFRPQPDGEVVLPEDIVGAFDRFQVALQDAVRRGVTGDDLREGHSMMADPACRAIQERFAIFANDNVALLQKVLAESSNDEHRAIAAYVIGYFRHKPTVLNDLLAAMRDTDDGVRNNAMRALAAFTVLAQRNPDLGINVSPTWFVEMLNSLLWTDRNKATMTLLNLTDDRNPRILAQIRERSIESLAEMARWTTLEYAIGPYTLLGRIAGLRDEQIEREWSAGAREVVIKMALKPPKKPED